ncbi:MULTISPECIES: DUF58 domain-containing protein [Haloferax]|uniref:DUF58 domain-containing protein n=1 Tax=Haloferax marinum TaxID=2666143 RepID=A0A6A8G8V3_9EURY|nr:MULTISPECIES: DUF58 domain-containing protein [Haloferax]KAB1198227.1 DUF58 domain-containing protein [Haloferax sp. CBA1150]MRW97317.1 DUF58 domain-containing protein [Haloferax marinum]
MQATRRYWETTALAGLLVVFGVAIDAPILLLGGVGLASWLLAVQYRFYVLVREVRENLTVDFEPLRAQVGAKEPFAVRLSAEATLSLPSEVTISPTAPVGIQEADRWPPLTLSPETSFETYVGTFEAPIAGEFSFDAPRVQIENKSSLFTESFSHGDGFDIRVEPRTSDNIFIGKGGTEVSSGFGEHESDQRGPGVGAADLREYMPGDDISRIDWKATARLNKPHVREHDVETTREVGLVVDERGSMWDGPNGNRKIDYVRDIALAFATRSASMNDPIGLYTVSNAGVQSIRGVQATDSHYAMIRSLFAQLGKGESPTTSSSRDSRLSVPERAHELRDAFATDSTAYAETLRPYFETLRPYVEKVESSPLFAGVQRVIADRSENLWLVVFTDDTHREELLEAAKFASHRNVQLLVFLTPSVFYNTDDDPIESTYGAYHEFESFRKRLDRLTNVSAMEVSSIDRRTAVLSETRLTPQASGGRSP